MLHFKNLARTISFTLLIVSCSPEKINNETEQPLSISAKIKGWQLLPSSRNPSVEVTLTNNTADTLRYSTLSCSWQDTYTLDTELLRIQGASCDKNIPKLIAIPPRGKEEKVLILVTDSRAEKSSIVKFRVGFNWLTANNYQEAVKKIEQLQNTRPQNTENIVWSNPVEF